MAYRTAWLTVGGEVKRMERIAAAAITPGHLVALTSANKFQAHGSAGQNAAAIFAVEDDLQGREIGTAYSTGERVQANVGRPGDEVAALIEDGQTIAIGDYLESAGDGTLRKHVASSAGAVEYPKAIVAMALEAVDLSDSSAADPSNRIRVMVV